MEEKDTEGTVLSKMKPIVTMLTEALVKDFSLAYRKVEGNPWERWERTDENGEKYPVDDDQLRKDVEAWLLNLEQDMENESDRQYARMVASMIRKNSGWVNLLTNRVKKRLNAG